MSDVIGHIGMQRPVRQLYVVKTGSAIALVEDVHRDAGILLSAQQSEELAVLLLKASDPDAVAA